MASSVARRYAKALFDYATDQKAIDKVNKDLIVIEEAIDSSPELRSFLSNPVISLDKRQEILNFLWEDRVDANSLRFLMFLAKKSKLALLKDISGRYRELYRQAKNILNVKIISNIVLHKQEINDICHHLKLKWRKDIEPVTEIRKDILGGIKIQIGDIIYDFSLSSQLEKFKNSVMHA